MTQSAIVVGVGAVAGLGAAVAKRFAREGFAVTVVGRTQARLDAVVADIAKTGGVAHAFVADATDAAALAGAFDAAEARGRLSVAVFNAGGNRPRAYLESDPAFFEEMWRVGCFAGHIFLLQTIRRMLVHEAGSILITGASASLRGRAGFAGFASAKAGLRAIAQSAAREFGPKGLHIAHVVIDGAIDGERINTFLPQMKADRGEDGLLGLDAIAEAYWSLHMQHRSAWTHELDLRPFKEAF